MRIFVDTSALIALKDSSDRWHESALAEFESLRERPGARFAVTNYILSEVHAYFCRTPKVALAYLDHLIAEPAFELVRASARDEQAALDILRSSGDKTYSFADAVSFAVIDRLKIGIAFAFDRHFVQSGRCRVVPAGRP